MKTLHVDADDDVEGSVDSSSEAKDVLDSDWLSLLASVEWCLLELSVEVFEVLRERCFREELDPEWSDSDV